MKSNFICPMCKILLFLYIFAKTFIIICLLNIFLNRFYGIEPMCIVFNSFSEGIFLMK